MQLTEHRPGDHHFIRSTDGLSIVIGRVSYHESVIVGARLLHTNWPIHRLEELDQNTIEPLIEHRPEVVILGVGKEQDFPSPQIQSAFLQANIGLECMTVVAAARTFNILMSENRRALAAFILPGHSQN